VTRLQSILNALELTDLGRDERMYLQRICGARTYFAALIRNVSPSAVRIESFSCCARSPRQRMVRKR
jgi:hypothetical protein